MNYDDQRLRDQFCKDLAKAAARQLKKVPQEQRSALTFVLQDCCSLHSPMTSDLIAKEVKNAK